MRTVLKWVGRSLFGAVIAGAVLLGGPGVGSALDCPQDRPPDPYTCPPHTTATCNTACIAASYYGGECLQHGTSLVCCVCFA